MHLSPKILDSLIKSLKVNLLTNNLLVKIIKYTNVKYELFPDLLPSPN